MGFFAMVLSALIGIVSVIVGVYRLSGGTKNHTVHRVGIILFGITMIGIALWLGWPK